VRETGPTVARRRGGPFLAVSALLFLISAAGTIHWSRTMAGGMAMPGGWTMSMVWMPMPGETWAGSGVRFVAMWLVMMVAMMLPPLVPILASFRRNRLAALSGVAYFSVWALFGALVYALGSAVARAGLEWPAVARLAPLATGGALLVAGAVQVSAWKARQLTVCRACCAPASGAVTDTLLHGVRFGVNCSLCCLGLMAVLLVGGMMKVAVVAAVAVAVSLERLGPRPALFARAIGAVVMAMGAVVVVRAW
jgi:predicted metal-binding membrane protein